MGRWLSVATRAASVTGLALVITACGGGSSNAPPPSGQAPVIQSFAVSRSWVTTGGSAILKWSVTGTASFSVSNMGAVSGTSVQVTPTADTTYVLTATNQFGSTQAQVTLPVFQPPTVWFAPLGATTVIPVQGSVDYFDLFTPSAAWATAAGHVTVFKMYSGC